MKGFLEFIREQGVVGLAVGFILVCSGLGPWPFRKFQTFIDLPCSRENFLTHTLPSPPWIVIELPCWRVRFQLFTPNQMLTWFPYFTLSLKIDASLLYDIYLINNQSVK